MRRLLVWFAVLMTLGVTVSSCSPSPPPSASEVLLAMQSALAESGQPLPDGVIRLTAAPTNSPSCLTETLFSALYGEAARGLLTAEGEQLPPIGDGATYLSYASYPRELAVFRCSDLSCAATVGRLCQSRVDILCRRVSEAEISVKGRVWVEGCYVILAVCEDPTPAIDAAKSLID